MSKLQYVVVVLIIYFILLSIHQIKAEDWSQLLFSIIMIMVNVLTYFIERRSEGLK